MDPTSLSKDRIATFIRGRVAHYAGCPSASVGLRTPFSDYGLDSVAAVSLCADIEDAFDLEVEPTIAWDYPTIAQMAQFLSEQAPRA